MTDESVSTCIRNRSFDDRRVMIDIILLQANQQGLQDKAKEIQIKNKTEFRNNEVN